MATKRSYSLENERLPSQLAKFRRSSSIVSFTCANNFMIENEALSVTTGADSVFTELPGVHGYYMFASTGIIKLHIEESTIAQR